MAKKLTPGVCSKTGAFVWLEEALYDEDGNPYHGSVAPKGAKPYSAAIKKGLVAPQSVKARTKPRKIYTPEGTLEGESK